MKRWFVLFLLLFAAMVYGCAKKSDEGIVATVNGRPITLAMLDTKIEKLPQYYQTFAAQHKKEVVDEMVVEELLYDEARRRKLDRDPEIKELIADANRKILISRVIEDEAKKSPPVSEDDVKLYYEQNKEKYMVPEMIRASHILTSTEEEAKAAKAELDNGADFAEVAKKYSKDLTKDRGGDLGYFSRGQMIPEFEKPAFSLQTGQISDIIKTRFGYHIIKVIDRKPAQYQSFDEVKDAVRTTLIRDKQRESFEKFTDQLKEKAKISINDELLSSIGEEEEPAQPAAE